MLPLQLQFYFLGLMCLAMVFDYMIAVLPLDPASSLQMCEVMRFLLIAQHVNAMSHSL